MTKKFWKDWQKRLGETSRIWLFHPWCDNPCHYKGPLEANKFLSFEFSGDIVKIEYQIIWPVWNKCAGTHYHIENHTKVLCRKDIATIEFK